MFSILIIFACIFVIVPALTANVIRTRNDDDFDLRHHIAALIQDSMKDSEIRIAKLIQDSISDSEVRIASLITASEENWKEILREKFYYFNNHLIATHG